MNPEPPADDEVAFIQFSSGSTTEPAGCMLTPRAIAWQMRALAQALQIDPQVDTGVVWLPLAHDMGFFGCLLLSYWTGHRLYLSSPERFIRQPSSWFSDCARFGATVSATPGFGLDIASRVARSNLPPPIPMRRLVVGGDFVDARTLTRASAIMGQQRLSERAILPAYGLAEAVLAVSMAEVDQGSHVLDVDAGALTDGHVVVGDAGDTTLPLVSAGRPLPGISVSVRNDAEVGEILVRSPALSEGYEGASELTRDRFGGDGFSTGDLGFIHDGELYITGRLTDLMTIGGRNVYARDVEGAIADVPGLHPGKYAVVDVTTSRRRSEVVALVELSDPKLDPTAVTREVKSCAFHRAGLTISHCLFLQSGELPKTPSGKLQRWRCRELALHRQHR
jgi:fatty-acyl-CoA synthase